MAIRPTHELRLAEALLAEAYCQERAFEFRLPAAAYLVRLCQRQEGAVSASVLIALGVRCSIASIVAVPATPDVDDHPRVGPAFVGASTLSWRIVLICEKSLDTHTLWEYSLRQFELLLLHTVRCA